MGHSAEYPFQIGARYPSRSAASPQEYLDAALHAERYVAAHMHHSGDGAYWLDGRSPVPSLGLSTGNAGIAYFYYELARATGRDQWHGIAVEAARYLCAHWQEAVTKAYIPGVGDLAWGYHGGVAGIGSVLAVLNDDFHDQRIADVLSEIGSYMRRHAQYDDHGAYWTGSGALLSDGGVLLFLMRLYASQPEEGLRQLILDAGDRIRSSGIRERCGMSFDGGQASECVSYHMPNYELGTAGVGYALTKLYEFSSRTRYLDAARSAADYLRDIAVPQRQGRLIPLRINEDGSLFCGNSSTVDPDGDGSAEHGTLNLRYREPIYYLGTCHGPAGTSRFLHELGAVTGDPVYDRDIDALVQGMQSLGAPECQSAGLWNAVHFCCGHAGLVQFFIGLYRHSGEQRWLDLAQRCGSVLLGTEERLPNGASDWPIAFDRICPDRFSRPLGYYDGAVGIGASLLQLYMVSTGQFRWDRLPDDPFPSI